MRLSNKFFDKIMKLVSQIRFLGEILLDKRIVEKVLVSLSKNFESKISSLEGSKNLNSWILQGLSKCFISAKAKDVDKTRRGN